MGLRHASFSSFLLTLFLTGCATTFPPNSPPTVWNKLGFPQAWNRTTGNLINRNGKRPWRELKPPLKRIADPSNLESDVPAIKEAAKVKMAEDQKKQKIKAVRYLAESIGCGCYDDSGEITDALIASLDDCTEEVRYATVESLLNRAIELRQKGRCSQCRCNGNCCNEKMMNKLSEVAYDFDDEGCRIEPSARVRATAKAVLKMCCPQTCQLPYVEEAPAEIAPPVQDDPPVEGEKNLEGPPMDDEPMSDMPQEFGPPMPTEDAVNITPLPPAYNVQEVSYQAESNPLPGVAEHKPPTVIDSPALDSGETFQPEPVMTTSTAVRQSSTPLRPAGRLCVVRAVSPEENGALIAMPDGVLPERGQRVVLKKKNRRGRIDTLGLVEVSEVKPGAAIIRPLGTLSVHQFGVGDEVMISN